MGAVGKRPNVAMSPPRSVYRSKRSAMVDRGMDTSRTTGRQSYPEKAKKMGIYEDVCGFIYGLRKDNPDSTYQMVYVELRKRFPKLFTRDEQYSGNISKIINSDCMWSRAYFSNRNDLINKLEFRVANIADKADASDKDIIKAYDTLQKYKHLEKIEDTSTGDMTVEFKIDVVGDSNGSRPE